MLKESCKILIKSKLDKNSILVIKFFSNNCQLNKVSCNLTTLDYFLD